MADQGGQFSTEEAYDRQGDPLSPMLFILMMEVLHRLFIKATDAEIIQELEVPAIKYQCSLYADGVIIFAGPTTQEGRAY